MPSTTSSRSTPRESATPERSPLTVFVAVMLLTGVGAGLGGMLLALLLHWIQHLAFGYSIEHVISSESFLDGVSGALGGAGPFVVPNVNGAQSFAEIFDDGTEFWLIAGVGVTATASCISWSNFTGPGVVPSAVRTTTRAPYWAVAESNNGSNQVGSVSMWANSACVIQSLQGQWTGVSLGPTSGPYNDVAIGASASGPLLWVGTNGPYLVGGANCVLFPGRSSGVDTSTYYVGAGFHAPSSVALPSLTTALCGLTAVGAVIAGNGDSLKIVPDGRGGQTASVSGGVEGAAVTCMPYNQP